jgi:hypothetical protein
MQTAIIIFFNRLKLALQCFSGDCQILFRIYDTQKPDGNWRWELTANGITMKGIVKHCTDVLQTINHNLQVEARSEEVVQEARRIIHAQ